MDIRLVTLASLLIVGLSAATPTPAGARSDCPLMSSLPTDDDEEALPPPLSRALRRRVRSADPLLHLVPDMNTGGAAQDGEVVRRRGWSGRRVLSESGAATTSTSTTSSNSKLTPEQWRRRQRNKQTRLFMIQRQIMASLGLRRRPQVPRRRDRNITQQDIERLMPVLEQQQQQQQLADNHVNSTFQRSPRLYLVKRVPSLPPTCLIPVPQAVELFDNPTTADDENEETPRSSSRSRSRSKPLRLYFNTSELVEGSRRSVVQVKSAVLRLHWNGQMPQQRAGARRREVTSEDGRGRVLARRRRPPGNGPDSSNMTSGLRLTVFQLTRPAGSSGRRGGRKVVKSVTLRETSEPTWVRINIKSAVQQWIKKPRRNYGIQVVARDASRRQGRRRREYNALSFVDGYDCCIHDNQLGNGESAVPLSSNDTNNSTDPSLEVVTLQQSRRPTHRRERNEERSHHGHRQRRPSRRPTHRSRSRSRDRRDVTDVDKRKPCAMGTMVVSFADMGWDKFVIAPRQFVTGYCLGSCSTRLPAGNSTSLDDEDGAGMCCAPSELAPLKVLLVNEQNTVALAVLSDVVVKECDCRR